MNSQKYSIREALFQSRKSHFDYQPSKFGFFIERILNHLGDQYAIEWDTGVPENWGVLKFNEVTFGYLFRHTPLFIIFNEHATQLALPREFNENILTIDSMDSRQFEDVDFSSFIVDFRKRWASEEIGGVYHDFESIWFKTITASTHPEFRL